MTEPRISAFIKSETLKSLGCPFEPDTDMADAWMKGFYAAVEYYDIDEDEEPVTEEARKEFINTLRGD